MDDWSISQTIDSPNIVFNRVDEVTPRSLLASTIN